MLTQSDQGGLSAYQAIAITLQIELLHEELSRSLTGVEQQLLK